MDNVVLKNKDSITYDVKAKLKSGRYIFIADMLLTSDEAGDMAESIIKKDKGSIIECVEVWETKNKMTTNFLFKKV